MVSAAQFLLEKEFTLRELQAAYGAATGMRRDRVAFRRSVEKLNMIYPAGERTCPGHRPERTYQILGMSLDLDGNVFSGGTRAMTV